MKCKKIAVSVAVRVDGIAATVAMLHCSWMLAIYNVDHDARWICTRKDTKHKKLHQR